MKKQEEKILKEAVVCYLVEKDNDGLITHVWLAMKNRKIGMGCRNGYGGGIEAGETEITAAIRETAEESKVNVISESIVKMATVYCHNKLENGELFICPVHMYVADKFESEPVSCADQGMEDPQLYSIKELPLEELMSADREWLPQMLSGKKMIIRVYYEPFQKSLYKATEIEFVDKF